MVLPIGAALLLATVDAGAAERGGAAAGDGRAVFRDDAAISDEAGAPSAVLRLPGDRAYRLLAGTAIGRGLRFNNPYRLQTQLGEDAQSLSLTATYLDLSVAAAVGASRGIQHGVAVHGSIALDGIPQEVVTPSYLFVLPLSPRWLLRGRAGLPVVIEPDANVGFELAAGAGFLVTGSFGVAADLVASLFYGAATPQSARSAVPLLSAQLGLFYQYEVLPR